VQYGEIRPHRSLARFVRCYWVLVADDPSAGAEAGPAIERVFPDGCAELIFHRGSRFAVARDGRFERQSRGLLFGSLERHIVLRRPARV